MLHLVGGLSDGLGLSLLPQSLLLVLGYAFVVFDLELLVELGFELSLLPLFFKFLPLAFCKIGLIHVDMSLSQ